MNSPRIENIKLDLWFSYLWEDHDESEYMRWMLFSKRTLDSARGDFERDDYSWACFKTQQTAEFALKVAEIGRSFKCRDDIVQAAKTLYKYYVLTGYSNVWVEGSPDEYYTRADADESIRFAENIIGWLRRNLT